MKTALGLTLDLPLIGCIQARFPSPAQESLSDMINLYQYLVEQMAASEIIPVPDNAMAGEGIIKDDLAIIEKRAARSGEIVLAEIDRELVL